MTKLDDKLIPKIAKIVDRLGKAVTFHVEAGSYDPTVGRRVSDQTDHSVKVTPPANYSERFIDGDNIQRGDVNILLPAQDLVFTPVNGMQVTIDAKPWAIVEVKPIYTGEQIGAYDLQLRT